MVGNKNVAREMCYIMIIMLGRKTALKMVGLNHLCDQATGINNLNIQILSERLKFMIMIIGKALDCL